MAEKRQNYGLDEIEKLSGLTCVDCRKCMVCKQKDGKYHSCLEPVNTLMSSGIDKMKKLLGTTENSSERERFVRAIIDRYEGATVAQVINNYRLYTMKYNKNNELIFKVQYGTYIKRGFAYVHEAGILDSKELGAVAKWLFDDAFNVLYDWDFGISQQEKINQLNIVGRKQIGKTIILDNEIYRVLNQEKGNLFVVKEIINDESTGNNGWFTGSFLENWLNVDWLENRPEVRSRLVHKIQLLTQYDIAYYGEKIPPSNEKYWLGVMPTDLSSEAKEPIYLDSKTNEPTPCYDPSEVLGLRPAFWICPSETMVEQAKAAIERQKTKVIPKKTESTTKPCTVYVSEDMPLGSVSNLLKNLKRDEDSIRAMDASEAEREVFISHLHKEAEEIKKFSKLDDEDFVFLMGKYGITLFEE